MEYSGVTCSAHPINQLGGGVGLSGWVVWYPFNLIIFLMWFLSHCPADIDISKLAWIFLFPSDQCAAPGIFSEAWGLLVSQGFCWELLSVVLSCCNI